MRWEDERYVRVYVRDTAEWLALGWEAQSLLVLLLRKADRAGIIHTGRIGVRGVAALVGMPLEVVQRALPVLMDDGCLRAMQEGGYVFPNFLLAQEAPASDAQRKREQRARDREKALARGLPTDTAPQATEPPKTTPDSSLFVTDVTDTVTATQVCVTDVTDPVTPYRAVPCLTVSASQESASAPPLTVGVQTSSAVAHTESPPVRPALVLQGQPAGKPPRKPSAAEVLFAKLEARREEKCREHGVVFVPTRSSWPAARINRDLGALAKAEKADSPGWRQFCLAWWEFLDDADALKADVPLSLDWFWKGRDRYTGRALKAEQGAA